MTLAPAFTDRIPLTEAARFTAPSHATRALAALNEPDDQPAPRFADVCRANAETMEAEARNARPGFWRDFCVRQARMWRRLQTTAE